jgi:hypothetical protein
MKKMTLFDIYMISFHARMIFVTPKRSSPITCESASSLRSQRGNANVPVFPSYTLLHP